MKNINKILIFAVFLASCGSFMEDPEVRCTRIANQIFVRDHVRLSMWSDGSSAVQVVCDNDQASMITTLPDGSFCACTGGSWDQKERVIRILPGGMSDLTEGQVLAHEAGHAFWDTVLVDDRPDQDWDDKLKTRWHNDWMHRTSSNGPWPSDRSISNVWEYFAEAYRLGLVDHETGKNKEWPR